MYLKYRYLSIFLLHALGLNLDILFIMGCRIILGLVFYSINFPLYTMVCLRISIFSFYIFSETGEETIHPGLRWKSSLAPVIVLSICVHLIPLETIVQICETFQNNFEMKHEHEFTKYLERFYGCIQSENFTFKYFPKNMVLQV